MPTQTLFNSQNSTEKLQTEKHLCQSDTGFPLLTINLNKENTGSTYVPSNLGEVPNSQKISQVVSIYGSVHIPAYTSWAHEKRRVDIISTLMTITKQMCLHREMKTSCFLGWMTQVDHWFIKTPMKSEFSRQDNKSIYNDKERRPSFFLFTKYAGNCPFLATLGWIY